MGHLAKRVAGEPARGFAAFARAEESAAGPHGDDGDENYDRLDSHGFAAVRLYLDRFWSEALDAFKAKVEEK